MADSSQSVLEFLEKLRRERDELNVLIAGLERRLGIVTRSDNGSEPANSELPPPGPCVKVSIESVPVGFFHNLSQVQAAEKLLRLNPGQPLTTKEILEAFRKSGMRVNPKHAVTILYTALARNAKFERVAGKAWGLSEWYPEKRKPEAQKKQVVENGVPEKDDTEGV